MVWVGLHPGHKLRQGLGRNLRVDGEHQRHHVGVDDGLEAFLWIPAQVLEQELVGVMAATHDADGVAIRCGFGQHIGAQVVGSAGPVVHDHRLPQCYGELVAHHAGNEVDGTTRRGWHDDLDGAGWPRLCQYQGGCHGEGGRYCYGFGQGLGQGCEQGGELHVCLLGVVNGCHYCQCCTAKAFWQTVAKESFASQQHQMLFPGSNHCIQCNPVV